MTLRELEYADQNKLPIYLAKRTLFETKEVYIPHILQRESNDCPFWKEYYRRIKIFNVTFYHQEGSHAIISRKKYCNCVFTANQFAIFQEAEHLGQISEVL